ncbi:MAG: caspase family protein, partial [Muribaculaceae bacterium]|nr:caspase family protein [Muribaculaceae bacterium]
MKNRILTLILSLIFVGAPVYSAVKQDITGDTYYQITRLSTPTIKIGGRDCKIGDSFQAGEKIDWTDSKQWMLVMNNATKKEVRFSKRTNEKMGLFESLLSFFMERTKGSTRGTYDYIRLVQNPDSLAFPEKRIALIVGIQNYPYMAPLKSAQKDAEDISDALFALGFDVMELYDSDYSELRAGLNKFAGLARNYDTALIYFAGHGIQDNSICYLLPVNYDPEDKVKGLNDCVSCNSIIQQLENLDNP